MIDESIVRSLIVLLPFTLLCFTSAFASLPQSAYKPKQPRLTRQQRMNKNSRYDARSEAAIRKGQAGAGAGAAPEQGGKEGGFRKPKGSEGVRKVQPKGKGKGRDNDLDDMDDLDVLPSGARKSSKRSSNPPASASASQASKQVQAEAQAEHARARASAAERKREDLGTGSKALARRRAGMLVPDLQRADDGADFVVSDEDEEIEDDHVEPDEVPRTARTARMIAGRDGDEDDDEEDEEDEEDDDEDDDQGEDDEDDRDEAQTHSSSGEEVDRLM